MPFIEITSLIVSEIVSYKEIKDLSHGYYLHSIFFSQRSDNGSEKWHYSDVTCVPWHLNSPASWLYVQQLVQDNINEIIKYVGPDSI